MARRTTPSSRAFTLIEILIVVGIIAVLAAFLMPVTSNAREQARRVQCASNIQQICLAAVRYAQDDERGIYIPTPSMDIDSFEALYPRYVKELRLFMCPSTTNQVNSKADLMNNAVGGKNGTQGHSYEIRGRARANVRFPDGMVFYQETLKNYRQFKHSSAGALIMDADDSTENGDQNNWPDQSDNHGTAGFNVGFMDGHVEFLPPGRRLLEAFLEGYYDPSLPDNIYTRWGVQHSGGNFSYAR